MSLEDRLKDRSRQKLGVEWHLPGKKRRFTTSTKATSDLLVLLAEDGHTFDSVRDAINFDDEAKDIAEYFVLKGYGDHLMSEHIS